LKDHLQCWYPTKRIEHGNLVCVECCGGKRLVIDEIEGGTRESSLKSSRSKWLAYPGVNESKPV